MPKEMLPLVDKPIIQYIVEELVEAGIEDIMIVTGYHKRSIEDHFDHMSADLRANLKQGNKLELLEQTKKISNLANFAYIRQKGSYGTATPILNAEHLIGDEPFIYTFADDFIDAVPSSFRQMIDIYEAHGSSVMPCIRVKSDEDFSRYGIVDGEEIAQGLYKLHTIVEKPGKENAPSNLASVSGFLLTPDIFKYIHEEESRLDKGKEFYLQNALQPMVNDGHTVIAAEIDGAYHDTGNKLEYVKTVIDFALKHEEIKDDVLAHLRSIVQ
jgi:UTP--glucose-1-phosphate uridylyltransferase